jgi:hypothetical protein
MADADLNFGSRRLTTVESTGRLNSYPPEADGKLTRRSINTGAEG